MRRPLLALSLFFPLVLGAQDLWVPTGTLVRVAAPSRREVIGTLRAFTAESLYLTTLEGVPRSFAIGDVRRVERSEGRSASAGAFKGMKIGAVAGAVAVAVVLGPALISASNTAGPGSGSLLVAMVGSGAASGALYGTVIGAFVRARTWTTVPLPVGGRLSFKPMRDKRVGVAVTYAF